MGDWHNEPYSGQMFFHLVDNGQMPKDLTVINTYPYWVIVGCSELKMARYDIVKFSDMMSWINQQLGDINKETHVAAYPCSTWEQAESTLRHVETSEEKIRIQRLRSKNRHGRIRIMKG